MPADGTEDQLLWTGYRPTVSFTVASWNMSKRSKAASRLPALLSSHEIDLLLAQEASLRKIPEGYASVQTPSLLPDTRMVARAALAPALSGRFASERGLIDSGILDG